MLFETVHVVNLVLYRGHSIKPIGLFIRLYINEEKVL